MSEATSNEPNPHPKTAAKKKGKRTAAKRAAVKRAAVEPAKVKKAKKVAIERKAPKQGTRIFHSFRKRSSRLFGHGVTSRSDIGFATIDVGQRLDLSKVVQASLTQQDSLARQGLPIEFVSAFQSQFGIAPEQTAEILQVSLRTLQRSQSQGKDLDAAQSGRLLRTAQIIERAKKLLGDAEARDWLRREQTALNYRVPIDLLETEPGARAVEQLLGRIDFGVYT